MQYQSKRITPYDSVIERTRQAIEKASENDSVYVTHKFMHNEGILFRLSNQSTQISFSDDSEMMIDRVGKSVSEGEARDKG